MTRAAAYGLTLTVLHVQGGDCLTVNGRAVSLPCRCTSRDRLSVVRLVDLKPSAVKAA
jgi:hypothetical protein